jgi:hypothetical protein
LSALDCIYLIFYICSSRVGEETAVPQRPGAKFCFAGGDTTDSIIQETMEYGVDRIWSTDVVTKVCMVEL